MNLNDNEDYLWYTRNSSGVNGPFTIGMVQRFVLIGRLKMDDEVSRDKRDWQKVKDQPLVIPEEMQNLRTDEDRERLLQAQLREDERSRERRKEKLEEFQGRRKKKQDRRQREDHNTLAHRQIRNRTSDIYEQDQRNIMPALFGGLLITTLVIIGIYVFIETGNIQRDAPDCGTAAGPAVNWNHCRMEGLNLSGADLSSASLNNTNLSGSSLAGSKLSGADLSYANLSLVVLQKSQLKNSSLKGANLRSSDLSGADLTQADLSYADLRGAIIHQANFSGANLHRAIWIDGNECLPGSTGSCKTRQSK